jgi:hypothetical protein
MKILWDWLRRKLGILKVEKDIERQYISIGKIERLLGKARTGKRSLRQDEVNRNRKRRKKAGKKLARSYT